MKRYTFEREDGSIIATIEAEDHDHAVKKASSLEIDEDTSFYSEDIED